MAFQQLVRRTLTLGNGVVCFGWLGPNRRHFPIFQARSRSHAARGRGSQLSQFFILRVCSYTKDTLAQASVQDVLSVRFAGVVSLIVGALVELVVFLEVFFSCPGLCGLPHCEINQ